MGSLSHVRQIESPVTDVELLELLGPPDYGDSNGAGAYYVYLYDRFGAKDWLAIVESDGDGLVTRISWNATSAFKLDNFKPYSPRPVSQP